jgi:mono/diheme cytochrome c family protein
MIKTNFNKKYFRKMVLMPLLVLFLTATMASASGKGHTHEKEGVHGLEIPEKYKHMKNPYWTDIDAIVEGSKIYKENCTKCHGKHGKGDGTKAKLLSKKPFSFEDIKHMSQMNDGYLYWRTVEGGKFSPFKSDMPAYKNVLTEKEVWQVLSYAHVFSHRHLLNHVIGEKVAMPNTK